MAEIIALSSNQKWENKGEKRKCEKGATGRHFDGTGEIQERKKGTHEKNVIQGWEKDRQSEIERVS
jgi:hypothetical protein